MIRLLAKVIDCSKARVPASTSGSTEVDHLVIVGVGGLISKRNEQFFVKAHVGRYLEELSHHFPKITYISGRSRVSFYLTPLQTEKITPILWDFRLGLRSYIDLLRQLMRLRNSRIAVLLQVPQTAILPFVPLLRSYSRRFIVYVAGDWIEINRELRGRGKAWRIPLDNAAVVLPIRWADVVLVRGAKLLNQVRRYNHNVVESPPIVATRPVVGRTDTCQDERVSILYVGKLLFSKGLDVVFKALLHLSANRPPLAQRLRLSIVGAGDDAGTLKNLAQDTGIDSMVQFCGYVDDPESLSRAYNQADILIVPSKDSEGLPRVIEEGMLHGLPVIATKVGGIAHTYKDREELLLVPPGNAKAVAKAIEEIVGNKTLRQRLILNCNGRVKMRYLGYTAARQHAEIILGYPLTRESKGSEG